MSKKKLYTGPETARILGYSPDYLRQMAAQGKIPFVQIGNGQRRFDVEAILAAQSNLKNEVDLDGGGEETEFNVVTELNLMRESAVSLVERLDVLLTHFPSDDADSAENSGD